MQPATSSISVNPIFLMWAQSLCQRTVQTLTQDRVQSFYAFILFLWFSSGCSTTPAYTSITTNSTTSGPLPSVLSPSTLILWSTWWAFLFLLLNKKKWTVSPVSVKAAGTISRKPNRFLFIPLGIWSDLTLKELPAPLAQLELSGLVPEVSLLAQWLPLHKRADTDHTCTFAVNHRDYFIFKYAREE